MIKFTRNNESIMASNTNQYNQVVNDLITFDDVPTAPPAIAISNGIYPSIPSISQQEPIQHNQLQMTHQQTPSYQGNTNRIEETNIQPIHHCFINDNGVSYQHIIIPSTDQNQIIHVNSNNVNSNSRPESQNKIPICYIGFHCIFLITLSITLIVMQVMLKYFGAGIWVGLFLILSAVITSFLVCTQRKCVIVFSVIFHILNIIVTSAGFVVIVIDVLDVDCFINYKKSCNDNEEFILYCGILVNGLILVLINLMFILFLTIKLNGCCGPAKKTDNRHIIYSHQISTSNGNASLINPNFSTTTRYQTI